MFTRQFQFFANTFIFGQNANVFHKNLDRWPTFYFSYFLTKVSIFRPHFNILTKGSIVQNCHFWQKISICDENFNVRSKFWFLTKMSTFDEKFFFDTYLEPEYLLARSVILSATFLANISVLFTIWSRSRSHCFFISIWSFWSSIISATCSTFAQKSRITILAVSVANRRWSCSFRRENFSISAC